MNRKVFMERLRECLADISAEEREDALTYYESYFEEAGVENEAQVIEELGSPEKVAENIKRDLARGTAEQYPGTGMYGKGIVREFFIRRF